MDGATPHLGNSVGHEAGARGLLAGSEGLCEQGGV